MFVDVFPGIVTGFREGMEAFLVIGVMIEYLNKIKRSELKRSIQIGMFSGIVGSAVIGLALWGLTVLIGQSGGTVAKLWESLASLLALVFLSTFIYWMMNHGRNIVKEVRSSMDTKLSSIGLMIMAAVMVLREGVEIALFAFTSVNKGSYIGGILIGLLISAVMAYLIYKSLVKVNLALIFNITLGYLILQAGYLLGYSIHEFLSASKTLELISPDSSLFVKLYNFQGTVLDHKTGILGVPLNILIGWYSRPERVQFFFQGSYIMMNFLIWSQILRKDKEIKLQSVVL
ncbi:MAG: FTR1 family protein [Spirochaetaceae bacterium]|nr:FTR1 family protein [Spirochaetaceae bacterium]